MKPTALAVLSTVLALSCSTAAPRYLEPESPHMCKDPKWCRGVVPEARDLAVNLWEIEERRAGGETIMSEAHVSYRFHDNDPVICLDTPYETCTWRAAPGEYVIEVNTNLNSVREAVCHEVWHVMLWEQGIEPNKHHNRMTTCYGDWNATIRPTPP